MLWKIKMPFIIKFVKKCSKEFLIFWTVLCFVGSNMCRRHFVEIFFIFIRIQWCEHDKLRLLVEECCLLLEPSRALLSFTILCVYAAAPYRHSLMILIKCSYFYSNHSRNLSLNSRCSGEEFWIWLWKTITFTKRGGKLKSKVYIVNLEFEINYLLKSFIK